MSAKYYFLIPILVLICSILQLINHPTLGITPDTKDYVKIAKNLPKITDSLFPIFYPLIIKTTNLITNNYFIATKLVCLISIFVTFYYPFKFKFFWKEIWIICAFPTFLDIYFYSWSETILIPLLIVFAHINYEHYEKGASKHFILKNTILLVLMLLTKYSSIGILFGYLITIILFSITSKKIAKKELISIFLTCIIFAFYLLINQINTGNITGERIPAIRERMNIRYSFFRIIYNLNPIINDRLLFNFKVNYVLLAIISSLFYLPLLRQIKKLRKTSILLIICSVIFLLLTIVSYFTVKLDNLDARLLMPYVFLLLVSLIISINQSSNSAKTLIKYRNTAFIIILFSLSINIADVVFQMIESPTIYLIRAEEIRSM